MANLSQEDMAEYLGLSRGYYSEMETGKKPISDDKRKKIFRLMKKKLPNVSLDDIFGLEEEG